jgi:flagellar biosynthetic protein FliR
MGGQSIMSILITDQVSLMAFWLVFTRWLVILMQFPMFEENNIPVTIKVLSALMISYAFFPFLRVHVMNDIQFLGEDHFWILTIYHTIVGLFIGFVVKAIMAIYQSAGSIISQQIGFVAMRYFDPSFSQSVGPFEILFKWSMVVIVISSGAILPMFQGAFNSFASINLSQLSQLGKSPEFFLIFFQNIFLAGLLLASPIIFTNLLIMAILGIVSRTVPQMNVLMISFIINIGLGMFVMVVTSGEFFYTAFKIYTEHLGDWFRFIS